MGRCRFVPPFLRRSIALQMLLASVAMLACAAYVSGTNTASGERAVLLEEIDRQGQILAKAAATFSTDLVVMDGRAELDAYLATLVDGRRVLWARVVERDGTTIFASSGPYDSSARIFRAEIRDDEWDNAPGSLRRDDPSLHGLVEFGLSTAHADAVADRSSAMIRRHWGITALSLFLVLAFIYRMLVHRPLHELGQQAERLGDGDRKTPIVRTAPDEIGRLAAILDDTRERLDASYHALEERNVRLEELDRIKNELLANTSHEMRTPLNGILGFSELLLDTGLSHEQSEIIHTIHDSAHMLSRLVDDFLDLGRLQSGNLSLDQVEFDLRSLVQETAEVAASAARANDGLRIVVSVDPRIPAVVAGDPVRVRQVLINLVGNAVKFTECGEVAVCVALRGHAQGQSSLRIEVEDTGIGIDPATRETLFQPFRQADGSIARRFGGAGLGLAICKKLVELMGGRIGIETGSLGRGSLFWVELRLPSPPPLAPPRAARPRVVALALDGHLVSAVAQRALEARGHRAVVLRDSDALTTWRDPDAIAVIAFGSGHPEWIEIARAATARFAAVIGVVRSGDILRERVASVCDVVLTQPLRCLRLFDAIEAPDPTTAAPAAPPTALPAGAQAPVPVAELCRLGVPAEPEARLLVVDDNAVNRRLAVAVLRKLGLRTDELDSGAAAVEAFERRDDAYALVLMDCHMPDVDGYEATRRIRALGGDAARTPIIAVTANAMPGARERCLEAGMDDYVPKPFRSAELKSVIDRWINRPRPGAETG
ncbi:MAG: response regulator [Planctomycetes bacterium]|nr:response regulator [Planctomycetota bacterium]